MTEQREALMKYPSKGRIDVTEIKLGPNFSTKNFGVEVSYQLVYKDAGLTSGIPEEKVVFDGTLYFPLRDQSGDINIPERFGLTLSDEFKGIMEMATTAYETLIGCSEILVWATLGEDKTELRPGNFLHRLRERQDEAIEAARVAAESETPATDLE
jgi:hypothetical protein